MKIKEIASSSNAYFRSLSSLNSSKGIKKEGLILVSGRKIVPELLRRGADVENLIFSEKMRESAEQLALEFKISQGVVLPKDLYGELDESGTGFPSLLMKAPKVEAFKSVREGLNVFLALSDPSNLGAALRSLKAFNAAQIILLKESANAFLPKVTKTASGSNLSAPLAIGPSIDELGKLIVNKTLIHPVCLDMEGEDLKSYKWPKTVSLILGEEGQGVPHDLKRLCQTVKIEMNQDVESLSAPVAISIAAWSFIS